MWQEEIAELCRRWGIPAAVVAVGGGGQVADAVQFGVCDLGSGVPVRRSTAFGVASVSKGMTAVAILQLVEQGRIGLDDAVGAHLPEVSGITFFDGSTARVRDLLSHTAGLPPLPSRFRVLSAGGDVHAPRQPAWVAGAASRISTLDHLFDYWRSLRDTAPLGGVGEVFSYSNEGYVMLGAIIERVTGRRLAEVVQEGLFDPLGMGCSAYDRTPYVAPNALAQYHVPQKGADPDRPPSPVRAPARYYEALWHAAGGVHTSAENLIRYLRIFETAAGSAGGVLTARARERMLEPLAESTTLPGIGYGAGLWLGHAGGERYAYHGGSGKGITSYVGVFPDAGVSCAVVTNVSGAPVEQLASIAMRGHFGRDISAVHAGWRDSRPPAVADWPAQVRGLYRSDEGSSVCIADAVTIAGETVDVLSSSPTGIVVRHARGPEYIGFTDQLGPGGAVTYGARVLRRCDATVET